MRSGLIFDPHPHGNEILDFGSDRKKQWTGKGRQEVISGYWARGGSRLALCLPPPPPSSATSRLIHPGVLSPRYPALPSGAQRGRYICISLLTISAIFQEQRRSRSYGRRPKDIVCEDDQDGGEECLVDGLSLMASRCLYWGCSCKYIDGSELKWVR